MCYYPKIIIKIKATHTGTAGTGHIVVTHLQQTAAVSIHPITQSDLCAK